jgi:putative salt-induced outer membrane protein
MEKSNFIMNVAKWLLILIILLMDKIALCELTEDNVSLSSWNKEIRFSFTSSNGNTEKKSISTRIKVEKPEGERRFFSDIQYYYDKENGEESEKKLIIDLRNENEINNNFFYLLNGFYTRDKYSGINSRTYAGPGVGRSILNDDNQSFKIIDSLNYERENLKDKNKKRNTTNALRLIYEYKIIKRIKVGEDIKYTISFNDTQRYYVDSETYTRIKINSHLFSGLSYIVNYQNIIPENKYQHTDRKFLLSLVLKL